MSWASQNTDELRLYASQVFNKHYLSYCYTHAALFTGKVTDEVFAEHLRQNTGFDIAGTTFRQYRNGSRFSVQFYAVISQLFNVPLAQFLLIPEQAESDFQNQLSARFVVLKDMLTQETVAAIAPAQATMLGINSNVCALVVTAHNNSNSKLSNGNIALIDTSVKDVSIRGDYVVIVNNSTTIVNLVRSGIDGEVVLKMDSDGETESINIKTKNVTIVGKVIGKIG